MCFETSSRHQSDHDIHAHRDPSGHWSAHAENHPESSFGGDTPETAALRLLQVIEPVHLIVRRQLDESRVVFFAG